VQYDPADSGYADDMGNGGLQALDADMAALFSNIPASSLWITRLEGELSRTALGADLQLTASADQSQVTRFFQATQTAGTAPTCAPVIPCDEGSGGAGGAGGSTGGGVSGGSGGGCALTGSSPSGSLFGAAAVLAALALVRRRARTSR